MIKHIAIAGNIGTGKSTLTKLLANRLGWQAYYEESDHNPYLIDFYHNMERWGFNMQMYLLYSRVARIQAIRNGRAHAVQERTLYEGVYIFAKNLVQMGLMDQRDYECYANFFQLLRPFIPAPDLLIVLHAPDGKKLRQRYLERNQHQGFDVSQKYFDTLNALYEELVNTYSYGPMVVFNTEELNFATNEADMDTIVRTVIDYFPDILAYR